MKLINLTRGKVAIVDDSDFKFLNQWNWFCNNNGYAVRNEPTGVKKPRQIAILMHRQIIKTPKGMETDHLNHNRLDNRKSNLRVCIKSQNQWHQKVRSGGSSKYKGVSVKTKRNKKFCAAIRFLGKVYLLGSFYNEKDAAIAYNKKAKELHGEFALLNNILEE